MKINIILPKDMKMDEMVLLDSFKRKIDYLRLSVTDRCNLRCKYCMPGEGIRLAGKDELLTYEEILKSVSILGELGIRKLRLTGGEPLLRDDIQDLIYGLSRIDDIEHISITTNGTLLEKYLGQLYRSGIESINVSLDSLDGENYRQITRGGDIKKVIRAINKAIDIGLKRVKVNVVISSALKPEDIEGFIKWAMEKPLDIRFIEMMQVMELDSVECSAISAVRDQEQPRTSMGQIFSIMAKFGSCSRLEEKRGFGPAEYYKIEGSRGNIGFIANDINSCFYCNRIRITPVGVLRLCLFSDDGLDLKKMLRGKVSEKNIKNAIIDFIEKKPKDRNSNSTCGPGEKSKIPGFMNKIGG
ncbi:MAG: GTP 3',8-cyclase MoaA [Actinobacteria bacterium]|nr:GTP 3',8-cyclase MoaA [Actinomycetota bacterium]